jgi:transcription antitermination factor NusG
MKLKPGDKVKIVKGPYKGMRGILRSRITETDSKTKERTPCWTVWINGTAEMVYESEVKE